MARCHCAGWRQVNARAAITTLPMPYAGARANHMHALTGLVNAVPCVASQGSSWRRNCATGHGIALSADHNSAKGLMLADT